jgi:hypothetical protein
MLYVAQSLETSIIISLSLESNFDIIKSLILAAVKSDFTIQSDLTGRAQAPKIDFR